MLALIGPLKADEEENFLFVDKQQGGKSTCHKTLMKAETYAVRKELVTAEYGDGMPKYRFEASVMLPTPPGRCRKLVKKCFPLSTQGKYTVSLGKAHCYEGRMAFMEGITLLANVLEK